MFAVVSELCGWWVLARPAPAAMVTRSSGPTPSTCWRAYALASRRSFHGGRGGGQRAVWTDRSRPGKGLGRTPCPTASEGPCPLRFRATPARSVAQTDRRRPARLNVDGPANGPTLIDRTAAKAHPHGMQKGCHAPRLTGYPVSSISYAGAVMSGRSWVWPSGGQVVYVTLGVLGREVVKLNLRTVLVVAGVIAELDEPPNRLHDLP